MIAYPDPDSLIIISNGSSLNDTNTTKLETNISAEYQCTRDSLLLYRTTCHVIFRSKTVYSAGLYTAIFSNVFGNVSFTFEVKGELHPATKSTKPLGAPQITEENITVPVVGGVIGGVCFVVLVVAIIILVVRRKGTNKKETPQLTEAIEEEQNEETETDVDKSHSQSTTTIDSTAHDVYSAVVKKGVKPTATDSTDSAVSPTNKDVKSNKEKEKSKKTAGKGKKKEKETFSKSPKGASEYEIFGFDETQGQKMKGAKETKRRKEQNLNYTIVVFDDTLNTPTPTPTSDRTVYAEIVGGKVAKF
ncbi:uncharacterized protein LOC112567625 [Pomacea canaliculata]|uniref:uncharacterized protein LOC112567625 n=1 Tax=Pomacea canaliculata TaxID=400727 RepID=UPI000D728C3B|nr:uncharacterized protein LOC112567625 [Pomacea canaliculata]